MTTCATEKYILRKLKLLKQYSIKIKLIQTLTHSLTHLLTN